MTHPDPHFRPRDAIQTPPVSFRRSILLLKWTSKAVDPIYMNILYVVIAVLVILVLLRLLGVV